MSELFDERLLRPLEVAQECHEYVYAAGFLPRWRYVPDLAIRALVPDGGPMNPRAFLRDLERKPEVLRELADALGSREAVAGGPPRAGS